MKDQRTDAELNRVIAGWMGLNLEDYTGHPDNPVKAEIAPPNYCTDLNAIQQAVMNLPDHDKYEFKDGSIAKSSRCAYVTFLMANYEGISIKDFEWSPMGPDAGYIFDISNTSARQRAEALVRVIE